MAKCTVKTRTVASGYASGGERSIEVSNGRRTSETYKGALISIRELSDGRLCIEVYRADTGVVVRRETHTAEDA